MQKPLMLMNMFPAAPHMHAQATEALAHRLKPGAKVLDIGSGSGYLTAVFAHLVVGIIFSYINCA